MRKKWFVGIFVALISMTCISGCGVSYKDYTDIQQTETETEQTGGIETNREYIMEEDVMKLPSDAVIIDDYSKEGTILTSPHLNYNISIKVNKAILADNMDAYKEIGGTDSNFIEWIKKVNSREAGFTNTYNEADGTFDSRYDGIGTKIFMISAELVNNSDSEAAINIAGIKPYSLDRENGEITRLSICESIFYDYAESTGADYGFRRDLGRYGNHHRKHFRNPFQARPRFTAYGRGHHGARRRRGGQGRQETVRRGSACVRSSRWQRAGACGAESGRRHFDKRRRTYRQGIRIFRKNAVVARCKNTKDFGQ